MALHLVITGSVQGVGYRYSMCVEARRLGVSGWVRNRADGSVEAVIEGNAASLHALIDWTHRGPPQARVEGVNATEIPDQGNPGFQQRQTE